MNDFVNQSHDVLNTLVTDPDTIKTVAQLAGINTSVIAFTNSYDSWLKVISQANNQEKMLVLLEVIKALGFENNQKLQALIQSYSLQHSKPKIFIFTAITPEYKIIRKLINNPQEAITQNGTIYEKGTLGNFEIWLAQTAGMGNEEAAIAVEKSMIFNPKYLFFIGVAGGIKDVKLGDIVVANKIYGFEYGKQEKIFKARPEIGLPAYGLQERARIEAVKEEWLEGKNFEVKPEVFMQKPIAAGSKVLADTKNEVFKVIHAHYNDAIAIEMEGLGFLKAANQSNVDALVIRGISDLLDNKNKADKAGWQEKAAYNAATFAFHIISKL